MLVGRARPEGPGLRVRARALPSLPPRPARGPFRPGPTGGAVAVARGRVRTVIGRPLILTGGLCLW